MPTPKRLRGLLLRALSGLFPVRQVRNAKDREAFTKLWHTAWLQEAYYAYPEQPLIQQFSVYDRFSVDLLVMFLGVFPAGTFRFIHHNSEVGLPILKDFEVERIWKSDNIIEATLLTVPKVYRRVFHLPGLVLMRELAAYCRDMGLEGVVMMVDERLFRTMRDRLGFAIRQVGPEKFYEGSVTYPAYIETQEFHEVMSVRNPFFTSLRRSAVVSSEQTTARRGNP